MKHQVYIISRDSVVLYVGRTTNLRSRLYSFKRRTGVETFDLSVLECNSLEESMVLELRKTDELKPTLMRRRVSSYGAFSASFSKEERRARSERARKNNPGKSEASRKAASERMKRLNAEANPSKLQKNRDRKRELISNNREPSGRIRSRVVEA